MYGMPILLYVSCYYLVGFVTSLDKHQTFLLTLALQIIQLKWLFDHKIGTFF